MFIVSILLLAGFVVGIFAGATLTILLLLTDTEDLG